MPIVTQPSSSPVSLDSPGTFVFADTADITTSGSALLVNAPGVVLWLDNLITGSTASLRLYETASVILTGTLTGALNGIVGEGSTGHTIWVAPGAMIDTFVGIRVAAPEGPIPTDATIRVDGTIETEANPVAVSGDGNRVVVGRSGHVEGPVSIAFSYDVADESAPADNRLVNHGTLVGTTRGVIDSGASGEAVRTLTFINSGVVRGDIDLRDGGDTYRAIGNGEAADGVLGGSGDDSLIGARQDDVLSGGADDDHIEGRGGDDALRGDDGDDRLEGGSGDDLIRTGSGNDLAEGGRGNDEITVDAGANTVTGGAGEDIVRILGIGATEIDTGPGADTIILPLPTTAVTVRVEDPGWDDTLDLTAWEIPAADILGMVQEEDGQLVLEVDALRLEVDTASTAILEAMIIA